MFILSKVYIMSDIKRCLVAGGAGFIGTHLCEKLLSSGNIVICLDNLNSGSVENIKRLESNTNFSFIHHDINSYIDADVDIIYNLACPASPNHYQRDPIYTTKTCVIGSLNLLELANKRNIKIFQASTSEIYGDPEIHPQVESYRGYVNPIGIRSCYDEGKRCAESLFFDYQRHYDVNIRVARIFNTYGPYMRIDDGRVVTNFIYQALTNNPLTIYGNGSQTRSLCYIDDLVDGIIKFTNLTDRIKPPVNLGNPSEITILDLAKKIISLTSSNSKIVFGQLPQDDPCKRCPDISLAKDILEWTPTVTLEKGLCDTIEYYKNILFNKKV